jgi:hypothetical protein
MKGVWFNCSAAPQPDDANRGVTFLLTIHVQAILRRLYSFKKMFYELYYYAYLRYWHWAAMGTGTWFYY